MSTAINTTGPTESRHPVQTGFIIGPIADSVLIIGAPLVALAIAVPLFAVRGSDFAVLIRAKPLDLRQLLISMFINAHLFLVFFRSHANPKIFRLYPSRFVLVPIGLFAVGAASPIALGVMGAVAIWWDVYHSSLQTFGFGRIYDAKRKNHPETGRRLDYWMNLFVYTGPVIAGAHFVDHVSSSLEGLQFLSDDRGVIYERLLERTPRFLQENQPYLTALVLVCGIPFVLYYIYSYWRLEQQGYSISWQKIWLLVITSLVSIYCWGFRSFIDAFWVMNFFHALQYFAIVAFAEHRSLTALFRVAEISWGGVLAIFWVVAFCLLYGLWSNLFVNGGWSASLVLTTSLMHFWYDGFIWSVKKQQV